jgi:hypothetical protein
MTHCLINVAHGKNPTSHSYIKVTCEDEHGFTFSCPYNQKCLDQYVLGYSLATATAATAATDHHLLCLKDDQKTFGFFNQNGLFVELISAKNNIYDKLGRLMLQEQLNAK